MRSALRSALCRSSLTIRFGFSWITVALIAACAPSPGALDQTGVTPPSVVAARGASVDGLIVGHRLMEAGEYDLALKAYSRTIPEQGLTVDVLSAIGSANLELGRLGQSERFLRRALELDESFVPAWNNLGVVLISRGEYSEAREVFRIAYGLDRGESTEIRENLRLAEAKMQEIVTPEPDTTNFRLVRRGNGRYLLLGK